MDDPIKDKIKSAAYQYPDNPRFVRRVLNRLPEPDERVRAGWIVWVAYLVSAIILMCYGYIWLNSGIDNCNVRMIAIPAMAFCLIVSAVYPAIRKYISI